MFKKLLQLKTLLVALLVMTGAGNVWGEQAVLPNTQALTTSFANVGNDPNIQIKTSSANTYTNPLRIYANNTITIKAAEGYVINSVIYEASSTGNYVTNAQNATVTPEVTPTVSGKNVTWTLNNATEFTFKPSAQTRANSIKINYSASSSSCKTPTFSPAAGKYTSAQDVTISTTTDGATIYYTTDGTNPTTSSSSVYSTPISVSATTTIKAMAAKEGMTNSNVATATYVITDNAAPSHNVTWSVNGETTVESYNEGANIIFPANPDDINGKTFVGWVTDAIEGTTDTAPSFVTSATMGSSDVTYYAVFANREGGVTEKDELNRALTGVTETSYTNWSDKTDNSAAVYAGNSAGGNSSIQLRSKNNESGIVTTTSGGTLTKVAVTWNSNTSAGRTLNVYGSNTAYGAAADLYNNSKQGKLLGTIAYGTSTELTVSGDYAYVGLRSDDGAMYLDQVDITWSVSSNTYSAYCTSVIETPKTATTLTIDATGITNTDVYVSTAAGALAATVRQKESNELVEGAIVTWTSSNTKVATIAADGTVALVAAGTTTLTATYAGDDTYEGSTDTYELKVTDSEPKTVYYKVTDAGQLGDGNKIAIVSEDYNVAMSTTQNTNNRGETEITIENDSFERTNDVQVITLKHLEENWRLYTGSGYLCAASSSNNYLRTNETADGNSIVSIDITDGNASMVFQGTYKRNTLQYNSTSNLFACYESASQSAIQIYRVEIPLSVSAAGYATFSSTSALDFTNVKNIYAYTATVNDDAISFTRVNKVPANTGLLLRSENEDAVSTRVPLYDGAANDVTDNAFVAATTEIPSLATTTTDGGFTNYILYKPSDGIIGFYKANGQKVGAGKAYLRVSSKQATTRAFIAFSFDDPETGVAQVETLPQQGVAYDLQGRRINAPKGGLYIINGKKVIVK